MFTNVPECKVKRRKTCFFRLRMGLTAKLNNNVRRPSAESKNIDLQFFTTICLRKALQQKNTD